MFGEVYDPLGSNVRGQVRRQPADLRRTRWLLKVMKKNPKKKKFSRGAPRWSYRRRRGHARSEPRKGPRLPRRDNELHLACMSGTCNTGLAAALERDQRG